MSRYRRPEHVLRLLEVSTALVVIVAVVAATPPGFLGGQAGLDAMWRPDSPVGRVLVGLVQLIALGAGGAVLFAAAWHRRYRLLGTIMAGGAIAAVVMWALARLVYEAATPEFGDVLGTDSWLGAARYPNAVMAAALVAAIAVVSPWLDVPWRRAIWASVATVIALRIAGGAARPTELALAAAVGATTGWAILVAFGAPDRRLGVDGVARALDRSGLSIRSVERAPMSGHGARAFVATDRADRRYFVKVLGRDERAADILYRLYRLVRLRDVGDTVPASTLKQAVEHQALAGMMAERAGVRVPHVDRVLEAEDGSTMLSMELVTGRALSTVDPETISDDLLRDVGSQVGRLHAARIAHRSLRPANLMVDGAHAWIVDFSFAELDATPRQMSMDVAELLASLGALVGPTRVTDAMAESLGVEQLASALPLLQPLALSAGTRRELRGQGQVLPELREEVSGRTGDEPVTLAHLQRVQGRTLLMIAVAAGAFYFLLPQLAQAGASWRAFRSADLRWIPVVVAMSALTYLAAGVAMLGVVPQRLLVGPTILAQLASSFVNRVTPASVGGMALNARYLEKSGVPGPVAVAGVGLNSAAGGVAHIVLIVVFFSWSGSALAKAFTLPSGSKVLAALAALAAVAGGVLLTRWGRHTMLAWLRHATSSAVANLGQVAKSPTKLALLFGGSLVVTLAYIAALAASATAFGSTVEIAAIGTVYLAASAVASASPTPGNLGALEAALVAGLTGVGMPVGPAVSTVLTYRLATYWLPVLPGWAAWHVIQRRSYV